MANWFRFRRRASVPSPAMADPGSLVEECEAYVQGHFLDLLKSGGQPLPGWVWINPLAHGTIADIRTLADHHEPGPSRLVARVANEMLRRIESGEATLPNLQWRTLIPLEIQLARQSTRDGPTDATGLARAVVRVLDEGLVPLPPLRRS